MSRELELLESAGGRAAFTPPPEGGPPAIAAAVMLVALCAAPCRAADVQIPAGKLSVRVYLDVSKSVRLEDTQQILRDFIRGLTTYDGANTLHVSMTPFYENAFSATTFVDVTLAGKRPRDCPLPITEIARFTRGYGDARQRQCEQILAQTEKGAEVIRSTEISKLSAAVDQIPALKLVGQCTAVNAMIRRAALETPAGVSVVITDAEDTCLARDTPVSYRPGNRLFLVPVGSHHRPIEAAFDDIEARFKRTMPWVQVIESYRLQVVMDALNQKQ